MFAGGFRGASPSERYPNCPPAAPDCADWTGGACSLAGLLSLLHFPWGPEREGGLKHRGPWFRTPPPRACAANADRSLTDGKPILRENWVLLSHPPSSPGRPSCGQGGGLRGPVCWPCSQPPAPPGGARPESAPRSGPSQAQPGQAHSQGQGPGVQTRRVTAAGARRPGVVGAWARARRTGGPLLPQAGWRLSLGPSLCYSKGAPLGRGIPQSGFKFSLSALRGCEHVTSPLGNSAPSISKWK